MNTNQYFAFMLCESPRWARDYNKLSSASRKKLTRVVPAGKTRQVGRVGERMLGSGGEKNVYASFTGGKGPSATAVFRTQDARDNSPGSGKMGRIWTDKTTLAQRQRSMKELSDTGLGVRYYHGTSRGYAMERMRPVGDNNARAVQSLARKIRHKATGFGGMGNNNTDYPHAKINLASGPRTLADFDVLHGPHNVMLDRKGSAKLTDPVFFNFKKGKKYANS